MRRISTTCLATAIFGSAILLGLLVPPPGSPSGGINVALADDGTVFDDTTAPSLKDTLDAGLKARLPTEFEFVDRVVRMVDHGRIPLEMVQSTFLWARKKRIHQFQYFEHGLRMRAEQAGVQL